MLSDGRLFQASLAHHQLPAKTMAGQKRKGRGRLSAIELLPAEADDVVFWAAKELKAREREQQDIHREFNERLAALDLDIEPISKSSFNRHSMKMAEIARRVENTRDITAVLTEKLQPGQEDDLTIMTAELIKTLVFELLQNAGEAGYSPKQTMEMAAAIKSAASAQHISSARRQKLDQEQAQKVDETLDQVAKLQPGLTPERAAQIRRDVLGVKS